MRPASAPAPYIGPLVAVEPERITVISATPELYTQEPWPFRALAGADIETAGGSDLVIVDVNTSDVLSILNALYGSSAVVALDGSAALDDSKLLRLGDALTTSGLTYVWASSALYTRAAITIGSMIVDGAIGAPIFCRTSILRNDTIDIPIGIIVELLSSWMGAAPDRLHLTSTNNDEYQSLMLHFPGGAHAVCDLAVAPGPPSDEVYLQGSTGGLGWPRPGLSPQSDLVAVAPGERQAAIEPFLHALRLKLANGMVHGRASLVTATAIAHAISHSRATGETAAVAVTSVAP